jgi:hypothetical protein
MAKTEISRPQTANIPPFGLRLQPDLKSKLEDAARASGRSLNAELVARLQMSFLDMPDPVELQNEIERLRQTVEFTQRALTLTEGSQRILAGLLRALVEALPASRQKDELPRVAGALANSIIHKDGVAMAGAFADLFSDDPAVVEGMKRLAEELVEQEGRALADTWTPVGKSRARAVTKAARGKK